MPHPLTSELSATPARSAPNAVSNDQDVDIQTLAYMKVSLQLQSLVLSFDEIAKLFSDTWASSISLVQTLRSCAPPNGGTGSYNI